MTTPIRFIPLAAAVLVACLVSTSPAAPATEPPPERMPGSDTMRDTPERTPRQEAERDYGDAYREIAKAKDDLAKSNEKKAKKRFEKALERATRAVERDTTYHEAWNLVGYAARALGDYDHALAAYGTCLRLAPDYAPAREYLGEAYVELGRLDDAREQVAWLEKSGDVEMALDLAAKVAAMEKAAAGGGAEAAGTGGAQGAAPEKP